MVMIYKFGVKLFYVLFCYAVLSGNL